MENNIIYDDIEINNPYKYYSFLENIEYANSIIFPKEYYCSIYLKKLKYANKLILPEKIYGDLSLESYEYLDEINFSEYVKGFIEICYFNKFNSLILPRETGNIYLSRIEKANNIYFPDKVNGFIYAYDLKSLEGLKLPKGYNINNVCVNTRLKQEIMSNPSKYIRNDNISLVKKKRD